MHYIVVWPSVTIFVIAVIMLLLVHILSNAAVEYDVKQSLGREMRSNLKNVTVKEGVLQISEEFEYESEGIRFLILDKNEEILEGEYPEGFTKKISISLDGARSVKVAGEKYYVRDMWIKKSRGKYFVLRGILKKADVYSRYQTIELLSYLSVAGVFCVTITYGIFMFRRLSGDLKNMCQIAESIGRNMDLSQRMDEDNKFHEINVLAQANNRMLDQMEQNFQLQEQFTSDVAHELRTPVAVVMAQCQYTREKVEGKEDFSEALDVIYRHSKKINTMITQLLNFSRLEQDRLQIQKEHIDLVEIVQSVCEDQVEKAGDRISIKMDLKEACGTGDISLIAIVVQNLVDNAVKFSPNHGEIEVKTGTCDKRVFVSVRDYGCGIEEEDLERIFQRFYKCDKSRNAEGFGLGLPLSMKIAQKHGGTITVSSKPGEGSIFTLILPQF